jgi:hypothetical protein
MLKLEIGSNPGKSIGWASMPAEMNTVRLLGGAQLTVFAATMLSERLLASAVGSGGISEKLVSIAENVPRMRISNVIALVNSLAIILLGILFYIVFSEEYKIMALAALGLFLKDAIRLAVSKIGAYALIPLSQEFVEAGAPEASDYQTLGDFLYSGVDRRGYDIHVLFFCLGGIFWYDLLYRSGSIPQALSLWGLAAVSLLTIPVVIVLFGRSLTPLMILGLPYAPFEFVLGIWMIVKGFN